MTSADERRGSSVALQQMYLPSALPLGLQHLMLYEHLNNAYCMKVNLQLLIGILSTCFFYKHNVYKHTEPDFCENLSL